MPDHFCLITPSSNRAAVGTPSTMFEKTEVFIRKRGNRVRCSLENRSTSVSLRLRIPVTRGKSVWLSRIFNSGTHCLQSGHVLLRNTTMWLPLPRSRSLCFRNQESCQRAPMRSLDKSTSGAFPDFAANAAAVAPASAARYQPRGRVDAGRARESHNAAIRSELCAIADGVVRLWRLCVRSFFESVDNTSDSVLDQGDVEVGQEGPFREFCTLRAAPGARSQVTNGRYSARCKGQAPGIVPQRVDSATPQKSVDPA